MHVSIQGRQLSATSTELGGFDLDDASIGLRIGNAPNLTNTLGLGNFRQGFSPVRENFIVLVFVTTS